MRGLSLNPNMSRPIWDRPLARCEQRATLVPNLLKNVAITSLGERPSP